MKKFYVTLLLLLLFVSDVVCASEIAGRIGISYRQSPVRYKYDSNGNLQKIEDWKDSSSREYVETERDFVDFRCRKIRKGDLKGEDEGYRKVNDLRDNDMYCCRGDMDYIAMQKYRDQKYENDNVRHDEYKYSKTGARITEGYINGRYVDESKRKKREEKISELSDLFKNKVGIPLNEKAEYDLKKISDDQFQVAYNVAKMYGRAIVNLPSSLYFLKRGIKEIGFSFEADAKGVSATTKYPYLIIRVNCYDNLDYEWIYQTVVHEFGHILEYWLCGECLYVYDGGNAVAREWLSISGWHRGSDGKWQNNEYGLVNEYARKHPSEDFAESVLYYFKGWSLVKDKRRFISGILNMDKI